MPIRIIEAKTTAGEVLKFDNLTVLVGPNNCGKSQTLRDIKSFVTSGVTSRMKTLSSLSVDIPSLTETLSKVRQFPELNSPGHVRTKGVADNLQSSHEFVSADKWIEQLFSNQDNNNRIQLFAQMGKFWIAHLDARGRFDLTNPTEAYDTRNEAPSNALQKFYEERGNVQPKLRDAFKEAFGVDIALDWAAMKRWYLRVGFEFGDIPETAFDLDKLLKSQEELAEQGDGYKSFAGIALAALTFPDRLLLLDEPEAFLHPTQARVLGRWLAETVVGRSSQVIVATHSSDFLSGVLSANSGASIVRLNRNQHGTKYETIPQSTTTGLIQSPLLSSQPVLDALFYRGVVVCEGDPDRSIYQTVAHKYLGEQGGDEVLFIHTNGKDAAKVPLRLFHEAGIPVCSIVDIDVINSSEPLASIVNALTGQSMPADIEKFRDEVAASVEEEAPSKLITMLIDSVQAWLKLPHQDLRTSRRGLVNAATRGKSKWEKVKSNGIDYFDLDGKERIKLLIKKLSEVGVFVVPCGELEHWLNLGLSKGSSWNRAALEYLHDTGCPSDLQGFILEVLTFINARKA